MSFGKRRSGRSRTSTAPRTPCISPCRRNTHPRGDHRPSRLPLSATILAALYGAGPVGVAILRARSTPVERSWECEGGPVRTVLRGPDQPRGRRKRGARVAQARRRRGLPGGPDLLRTARLQLRLLRRGPRRGPSLPRRVRARAFRLRRLPLGIVHHHGLPLLPLHLQGPAGGARTFRGPRRARQGVLGLPGQRDGRGGPRGASAGESRLSLRLPSAARARRARRAARPPPERGGARPPGLAERRIMLRVRGNVLREDARRIYR